MKTTAQSASHMGTIPTSVLMKKGVVYHVVLKSYSNCGIGCIAFDEELSTCPFAVHTLIGEELVSGGPCGANGAM